MFCATFIFQTRSSSWSGMEYSKRKEGERSNKNSERSDRVKGVQRCERDMQRCTHKRTQKRANRATR